MAEETTQVNTFQRHEVKLGFDTKEGMDALLRAANVLSSSSLVPVTYRKYLVDKEGNSTENPNGLANCAVALNMATRMGADPLMIMQNMHVIEGRPSWSSTFIIASINQCGRFSPLRFELTKPTSEVDVEYVFTAWETTPGGKNRPVEKTGTLKVRHQECYAWAIEKATGERVEGPRISMQMAIDEGWLQKKGSKWKTMQEVMLRYRSASIFGRLYAPELLMGLHSAEEVKDTIDAEVFDDYAPEPIRGHAARNAPSASPVVAQWPIKSQEKFDELMDRAYLEFKKAGLQEHWQLFESKWRPRRNTGDDLGIIKDLSEEIDSFLPKETAKEPAK